MKTYHVLFAGSDLEALVRIFLEFLRFCCIRSATFLTGRAVIPIEQAPTQLASRGSNINSILVGTSFRFKMMELIVA